MWASVRNILMLIIKQLTFKSYEESKGEKSLSL